jgi:hypothetical protein
MDSTDISLVLCSCDNYSDGWYPFCYQLKKNWPEFNYTIYLNTESKSFHYDGLNIISPFSQKEKIFEEWSDRLLQLLEQIPNKFIILMLEDFWLTEKVNNQKITSIMDIMKNNESIGFICLRREQDENSHTCPYELLRESDINKKFRITTQAGMWRKSYLMKILRKHESAWYFETRATFRSKYCKEKVYDVKENILNYPVGGFFWGGKCLSDYINLYPEEITKPCIEKRGIINRNEIRKYPGIKKGLAYYKSIIKSLLPKFH